MSERKLGANKKRPIYILGLGLLLLRLVFLLLLWFLDVFLNLEINVLVLDLIVWVHLLRVLIVVNVDIIGWLMH